jgi:hypothetical protein
VYNAADIHAIALTIVVDATTEDAIGAATIVVVVALCCCFY